MQNMKYNCKKVNLILANAILYLFQCFTKYQPDDDPAGSKHVAIKITAIKSCQPFLLFDQLYENTMECLILKQTPNFLAPELISQHNPQDPGFKLQDLTSSFRSSQKNSTELHKNGHNWLLHRLHH
jgi:hypothetical protein